MTDNKLEERNELYCICQKSYVEGQFMIECGKCNEWFHGSCIGIEEYQAQDIDIYHCPKCQPVHGPLVYSFLDVTFENGTIQPIKVKKRRNVSRHNYKEINDGTKQISAGSVVFVRQLKARKFLDAADIIIDFQNGTSLSADYFQENGFNKPIVFREKTGLGIVVPPSNFTIYDVEKRVGSMQELHVIDVARQEDLRMKMREWTEYYNTPVRGKILNVISLEFSDTSMSDLVMAPEIVRGISWVETAWPKKPPDDSPHTKPAVAKYCLMSVKDCYTDFHVDFGGTSVWYHIVRGEKLFYLIEPTQENLKKFEQWVSSSDQGLVFFGDRVSKCYKLHLKQGHTLMIPTGWIHAVLTPVDSLVFGGNFLHAFNISLQQRIYKLEKTLNTPLQFLFPNFETTNWYAAQAILRKIKDVHAAGIRMPTFLHKGVKDMIGALKSWCSKKGDLVNYHKLQIPVEINASKLIKSLEKVVKIDEEMNPAKVFPTGLLPSPALLSVKCHNALKLKVPRNSESETSGVSSPERSANISKLERKREKLKRKEQRLKEELFGKVQLPSLRLNLKEETVVKKQQRYMFDDDSDDNDAESKVNLGMKLKVSGGKLLDGSNLKSDAPITLKLSIPSKLNDTNSGDSSPDVTSPFSQPFATVAAMSSNTSSSTSASERNHLVASPNQKSRPVNIKAEIEATKKDLFQSTGSGKMKTLYFSKQDNVDRNCTDKPVTFDPSRNFPVKPKLETTENNSASVEEGDEGGYVVDFLPKPKQFKLKKRKHSDEEDSDYDPSDSYYQDAEYVYPRIDVTSDIRQDDFSWKPGQRKKPKERGDKKLRFNSKGSQKTDADDFFAPDGGDDDDEDLAIKKISVKRKSADISDQRSSTKPVKEKSKKGFATAKQRLGKLLKLDKTGRRYVR